MALQKDLPNESWHISNYWRAEDFDIRWVVEKNVTIRVYKDAAAAVDPSVAPSAERKVYVPFETILSEYTWENIYDTLRKYAYEYIKTDSVDPASPVHFLDWAVDC